MEKDITQRSIDLLLNDIPDNQSENTKKERFKNRFLNEYYEDYLEKQKKADDALEFLHNHPAYKAERCGALNGNNDLYGMKAKTKKELKMFEMAKANLYKRRHVLLALFSSSLFTYKTWANASAPEMLDAGNLPEHVVVAVTLFCEARNQGYRGIRLVMDVIHNRRALEGGDTTLKDVCLRNYQFSCWNAEGSAHKLLERQDNRELPFPDSLMWSYCWVLACDKSYTPLNPYTHYYHKDLRVQDRPSWTWEMWHEYRYRDHIFLVMQK